MNEFYELIGGYLYIDKIELLKELLTGKNGLGDLLKAGRSQNKKAEIITEEKGIKIIFDNAADIDLDHNYREYFSSVKMRFGEKLKGRIVIRVSGYTTFLSIVDFNSRNNIRVY